MQLSSNKTLWAEFSSRQFSETELDLTIPGDQPREMGWEAIAKRKLVDGIAVVSTIHENVFSPL